MRLQDRGINRYTKETLKGIYQLQQFTNSKKILKANNNPTNQKIKVQELLIISY